MKYLIVGMHASGKQEIIDILEKSKIKCAHLFSNLEQPREEIYGSMKYEKYTSTEVNEVFENNAYLFVREKKVEGERFYEGLTKYAFENSDVVSLEPDQLLEIPLQNIKEDICFVWLDNTRTNRYGRYKDEERLYNFKQLERQETIDGGSFIKNIYDYPVLYFNNEEPARIATIIYSLVKYPDLFNKYIENFN